MSIPGPSHKAAKAAGDWRSKCSLGGVAQIIQRGKLKAPKNALGLGLDPKFTERRLRHQLRWLAAFCISRRADSVSIGHKFTVRSKSLRRRHGRAVMRLSMSPRKLSLERQRCNSRSCSWGKTHPSPFTQHKGEPVKESERLAMGSAPSAPKQSKVEIPVNAKSKRRIRKAGGKCETRTSNFLSLKWWQPVKES